MPNVMPQLGRVVSSSAQESPLRHSLRKNRASMREDLQGSGRFQVYLGSSCPEVAHVPNPARW